MRVITKCKNGDRRLRNFIFSPGEWSTYNLSFDECRGETVSLAELYLSYDYLASRYCMDVNMDHLLATVATTYGPIVISTLCLVHAVLLTAGVNPVAVGTVNDRQDVISAISFRAFGRDDVRR